MCAGVQRQQRRNPGWVGEWVRGGSGGRGREEGRGREGGKERGREVLVCLKKSWKLK